MNGRLVCRKAGRLSCMVVVVAWGFAGCLYRPPGGGDAGGSDAGTTGMGGAIAPDGGDAGARGGNSGNAGSAGGAGGSNSSGAAGNGGAPGPHAREWTTPEPLEYYSDGDAAGVQVAIDAVGNATAVWLEGAPGDDLRSIWANRYAPTSGWGTPTSIDAPEEDGWPEDLSVAVGSIDTATVVWSQRIGPGSVIWSRRFSASAGWGAPEVVAPDAGAGTYSVAPQVVVDGSGNATVAWHRFTGISHNEIWVTRYQRAAGWGTPVMLASDDDHITDYYPNLAVDGAGNVTAVWTLNEWTAPTVWANRFESGTGWGTAMPLLPANARYGSGVKVAADTAGNVSAAWSQVNVDSVSYHVWARRFVPGSGWQPAAQIDASSASANFGGVTSNDRGGAVLVWTQWDGQQTDVAASRFLAGNGWSTPVVLDARPGLASNAMVAGNPAGDAVALWTQPDVAGSVASVWSSRLSSAGGWDAARLLETDDSGYANIGDVAVDGSGDAVAVWSQSDGTQWRAWASSNR